MSEQNEKAEKAEEDYVNPFAPFTGMFSSGITDTSERMYEILRETEFEPAKGFSSGIKPKDPTSES